MKPLDLAEQIIIPREGFMERVRPDSLGILTGGWGHKILPEDNLVEGDFVDRDLAERWLAKDLAHAYGLAVEQANELKKTSDDFVGYLTSANYQLGNFESDFKNTFALLQAGDWQTAITHLQASLWMKQTPVRVNDLIGAIRRAYNPPWWKRLLTIGV